MKLTANIQIDNGIKYYWWPD